MKPEGISVADQLLERRVAQMAAANPASSARRGQPRRSGRSDRAG
jgi:hypothetical protein